MLKQRTLRNPIKATGINLLYRASFARADDAIALNYWNNMKDISQTGTDQVFSIRLVYFLDYAELLK